MIPGSNSTNWTFVQGVNMKGRLAMDDIHIQKRAAFENYFKAGNYLNTLDAGSYARVKYYSLEVSH